MGKLHGNFEEILDFKVEKMRKCLEFFFISSNLKMKLYIAEKDITNIPSFLLKTLIAIRAPRGATLVVPDPNGTAIFETSERQYQFFLKSIVGMVEVFLISSQNNKSEASFRSDMKIANTLDHRLLDDSSNVHSGIKEQFFRASLLRRLQVPTSGLSQQDWFTHEKDIRISLSEMYSVK